MELKRPSMIFFDFGGTLTNDKPFDSERAGRAVYACASNPEASDEETVVRLWMEMFSDACRQSHKDGIAMEIPPMSAMVRCTLDRAGLKTNMSVVELETAVQWQWHPYPMMPDADKLLDLIYAKGIRSAVISNYSISSATLCKRLAEMIPTHHFEFIITSSDYAYCKPSRQFFEAAFGKAGSIDPRECWYCGDTFSADIIGALGCGMTPILLDRKSNVDVVHDQCEKGEFLRVNAWKSLIPLVERL